MPLAPNRARARARHAHGGQPTDTNPNTQWIHSKQFKLLYIALLGCAVILYHVFCGSAPVAWTLTNVTHTALSFILFHWITGAPFSRFSTGLEDKYENLTFWEQIDNEMQNTPTRKFFELAPIILLFFSMVFTQENMALLVVNVIACITAILPKFPMLHRARFFMHSE